MTPAPKPAEPKIHRLPPPSTAAEGEGKATAAAIRVIAPIRVAKLEHEDPNRVRIPYEDPDGQISYTCTKDDDNDPDYMKPFERVANFCIEKNLNPHEAIDMIDEYTGDQYNCECYLLRDDKIRNLIERPKGCSKTHLSTSKTSVQ